jgi:hypothetical protein
LITLALAVDPVLAADLSAAGMMMLMIDGATLDPAEFAQSPRKSSSPLNPRRIVSAQEHDGRQLPSLLRERGDRPGDCRAA